MKRLRPLDLLTGKGSAFLFWRERGALEVRIAPKRVKHGRAGVVQVLGIQIRSRLNIWPCARETPTGQASDPRSERRAQRSGKRRTPDTDIERLTNSNNRLRKRSRFS